MQLTLVSEPWT